MSNGRHRREEEVMQSDTLARPALTSALTREQYAELRADLEGELRRLVPGAEQATEHMLQGLGARVRSRALQIIAVLRRMETPRFGVCASCQSAIAYERLSAIPETTLCAHCSWNREVALQG
jgi:RNA polymerase-binding transcription factor DksA